MHCSSCAIMIDGDLEELTGVKRAVTHFAKSETEVEFDETIVDLEIIIEKIQKTGYKAVPAS